MSGDPRDQAIYGGPVVYSGDVTSWAPPALRRRARELADEQAAAERTARIASRRTATAARLEALTARSRPPTTPVAPEPAPTDSPVTPTRPRAVERPCRHRGAWFDLVESQWNCGRCGYPRPASVTS